MKICEGLHQGSKVWHQYRALHIGASESAIIMGLNRWRTTLQLWEEKVLGWDQPMTEAMKRGQDMEGMARKAYEKQVGFLVSPMVAEHDTIPYISASFDGITVDLKIIVEIKCGKSSHKLAKEGKLPPYYFSQVQHQMFVAGLNTCDYYSFDGKEGILIKVDRDDGFIEQMLEKYAEFWESVTSNKPPPRILYETTDAF